MFNQAEYPKRLPDDDPLNELVKVAHAHLKADIIEIKYPEELRRKVSPETWSDKSRTIDSMNAQVLDAVKCRGGVYAILTADSEEPWKLRYIGQAKAGVVRQRIRAHLVWRNKRTESGKFTGSKFDEVKAEVGRKHHIGLSFVEVAPESLRHYVEEVLLKRLNPDWNFHGTTAKGQRSNRHLRTW